MRMTMRRMRPQMRVKWNCGEFGAKVARLATDHGDHFELVP